MNLQTQLAGAQNQRPRFLRALRRRMQCHRFFRNYRRMLQQIQRLHQLIPLQRMLPAKTVRIRPLLNFVALKRSGHNPAPGNHFSLVNPRPDARGKPRINLAKLHVRLGERHALHATHLGVRSQQQRQLRLQRNLEWVLAKRTLPAIHVRIFRRHHYVSALRQRRSLRDRDGLRRAGRHTFPCHSVRRRKSPRAVRQHANANPNRLRLRQRPHPPVLGRQVALPQVHHAHIGVRSSSDSCSVERCGGQIVHAAESGSRISTCHPRGWHVYQGAPEIA